MLRWPDRRFQLQRAAGSRIAELYGSYELASVAALHWAQQKAPGAAAIADDYRRIVIELEHEIAAALTG